MQLVPFSRHSPLPELRAFVSLFCPVRVVPNSLNPSLRGLDALCIPHLFASCLSPQPSHSFTSFADALVETNIEIGEDHDDPTLKNLVGDGADSIARAWADSARILDKLAAMEPFLRGKVRDVVRGTLGVPPLQTQNRDGNGGAISTLQRLRDAQRIKACRVLERESDRETQSEDEEAHARTAKLLFELSGRGQMADSQGMFREKIHSCESPLSPHSLIEEGSSEDAPVPKVLHAMRASKQQVSECGSLQMVGEGTSRDWADSVLAPLQTQQLNIMGTKDTRLRDADHKLSPSFSPVFHTSSLPASNRLHAASQDDEPPLVDLLNIPPTGTTKRRCIRSHSRSQSRSSSRSRSPPRRSSTHLHFQSPVTKRRKIETWLDDHYRSGASTPGFASSEAVVSTHGQGLGVIQVGKSTNAAPQTGSTEERRPDKDGESRRAQRRALRARSRAIEEKLRHALRDRAPDAVCLERGCSLSGML
jgi:hypothetical protein